MERHTDKIRDYLLSLKTDMITNFSGKTLSPTETKLIGYISYLSDYVYDAVDSLEKIQEDKYKTMVSFMEDQLQENDRFSQRTVSMLADMKKFNEQTAKIEKLEKQVENLTNIILRSLKDIPVKGGTGEEDTDTIVAKNRVGFSKIEMVNGYAPTGIHVKLPKTFEGKVSIRGYVLKEGESYSVATTPFYQIFHIHGPLRNGDDIGFEGFVDEGDEDV